jgi:hypothetical protein
MWFPKEVFKGRNEQPGPFLYLLLWTDWDKMVPVLVSGVFMNKRATLLHLGQVMSEMLEIKNASKPLLTEEMGYQ